MYLSNISNFIFRRPRLRAKLQGHAGSVVSLAFSCTGRLLASGGVDGVKVWDLKSMEEIEVPQQPFYERGQVSCICWITRQNDIFETLCYGNALGFLVFLQHSPAEGCFKVVFSARLALGGEILSMTTHISASCARIATGSRDKCIQVWDFDSSTCELKTVYSRRHGTERDIVPKALVFDNNPAKDVFAFGLYDGGMYRCSGVDGSIISRDQLGPNISNAAMDAERTLIAVDNVATGFDLYRIVNGDKKFVRTLEVGKPLKTYAKSVVFGNGSRAVITGSDHGKVYVFDRASGRLLTKMTHSKNGGVETISVHDEPDGSVLIASASVRDKFGSTPNHILVWKWTPKASREISQWSLAFVAEWTLKSLILCAAVAFVVECALKFHVDRDQIRAAESTVPIMADQAIQEYIKEQIAKNMIEKYIQSMNFVENQRPAAVIVSTDVIGNYDRLEVAGRSKIVTSQANLGQSDRELRTPRIKTIFEETEHPKYQDL